MSINATETPRPVEYCHAVVMLSMAKPGLGRETLGSAAAIVWAHSLLWRMGCSGPGGASGGTDPGSTDGGAMADAAGTLVTVAVSNTTIAMAAARTALRDVIASESS